MSVDDGPANPRGAVCIQYCRRLAACWYAIPERRDEMTSAEVNRVCLKEESDCRTPTTETLCCGQITDCQEFVRCQAQSRDIVSDCSHAPSRR